MSQNRLQDLPLHVFYGTVYLEILNMSQNNLLDPEHVTEQAAGLASARL